MLKKLLPCSLFLISSNILAADVLNLYQAPLSSLKQFSFTQKAKSKARTVARSSSEANTLQEVNQTLNNSKVITRYQQLYQGVPVVGAQVMIIAEGTQKAFVNNFVQVNGHVLENVQLNAHPSLSSQQALDLAQKAWLQFNPSKPIQEENVVLQIRHLQNNELKLVYQVSFKTVKDQDKLAWPFIIVDAQTGEIIKQWNNINHFSDTGPGGNEKTGEYWYGRAGLPTLEVTQNGDVCIMESPQVRLVNLGSSWDETSTMITPFRYMCNKNIGDRVNGAFSPTNDAYYFGHVIVNMYQEWYGLNALQNPDGTSMQLIMRVHLGQELENAYWDGQFMSFGDGGSKFYPLVSADIAGHEVTHGFTQQHAGLEYNDQSGALNESMSDMAGQATYAYLLEKFPQLYNRVNIEPDVITWKIGATVIRDPSKKAERFMDIPSLDGDSADCLDKNLAQSYGAYCAINYADIVTFANDYLSDPYNQQMYLVHTASGIFNKAFYLLANKIGIKKSYQVMLVANSKYWTPTTDFIQGACGVLYGARDLAVDIPSVKTIFGQVGIDTKSCAI